MRRTLICKCQYSAIPAVFNHSQPDSIVVQAVAVVQRAMRVDNPCMPMGELGFGPLVLVSRFPVSMSGLQHGS